jgi:hypothetical protein
MHILHLEIDILYFPSSLVKGPYAERIDLWFEPFFVKDIRRVIEWLRDIKLLTNIVIISSYTAK